MSLNKAEQQRTAAELQHNFELLGLPLTEVATDLGQTTEQVQGTLELRNGPVAVWLLRDYLCQAILDSGREPIPFSVLTEHSRGMARMWFDLQDAPRHRWAATAPTETAAE